MLAVCTDFCVGGEGEPLSGLFFGRGDSVRLVTTATGDIEPEHTLTPGEAFPGVTAARVCMPGYSASGASEHSRHTANASDFRIRGKGKWREPEAVIARYALQIEKLRTAIASESDPQRLAKLKRDIEIKSRLLESLRNGDART